MKGSLRMTPPGRAGQKDRTRAALLQGARRLMAEARPVTVAAAAELQGISRATAYRYFSDPAMLAAEAGLDVRTLDFDAVVAGATDVRDQLRRINLYFFDLPAAHEPAFRSFVGLTLTAWRPDEVQRPQRRGARRVAMYRQALAADAGGLDAAAQDRLVRALSLATGTEAMIALYDVAGADPASARATVAEVTEAILDRFLPR
jgi:AcrR family transcriptional regulator